MAYVFTTAVCVHLADLTVYVDIVADDLDDARFKAEQLTSEVILAAVNDQVQSDSESVCGSEWEIEDVWLPN